MTSLAAMDAMPSTHEDDERSLLSRIEQLLDAEQDLLVTRDADALALVAEQRERLVARLEQSARLRCAKPAQDVAANAELAERYRRLRHRHDVQALIVRRAAEQNARVLGVLAQATGQSAVYQANGRVAVRFVSN